MSPTTKKDQNTLLKKYSALFGAAGVKALKAVGQDVVAVKASGSYITTADGAKLLDCVTNEGVANLGHRPAKIAESLKSFARQTDQGNFPMISREKAALGKALSAFVPGSYDCVVYSVMRGESFDFSCKLARGYTGKKRLLAMEGCWFGQTGFPLSLSTRQGKKAFGNLIPETEILPAEKLADSIDGGTAAVFVELIQAENGCRVVDEKILQGIAAKCKATGALLIVDETQTGFGRTGRRFAFEGRGISPDVLILGEALGAGLFPICATVFSDRINTFLNEHPLIHLSTFGGSDLGCRVAASALELYEEAAPWKNAATRAKTLLPALSAVVKANPKAFVSAQGEGLLLAFTLKSEARARNFCKHLMGEGVFAVQGNVDRCSVLLRPSLKLSPKEQKELVAALEIAAKKVR